MGLILNYNLIFTNFCGPRWLWSLFGTNFCDFLHKRMVINNEANPIFSTFLLVTLQHKMWSSFSDIFFLKLSFFFLFLQQTGASIGSNFFQTLLWISLGWWKIYLFITIKDWWNTLSTVMSHHRWHMLCFAFQYRLLTTVLTILIDFVSSRCTPGHCYRRSYLKFWPRTSGWELGITFFPTIRRSFSL